jgi:hypothetical protein
MIDNDECLAFGAILGRRNGNNPENLSQCNIVHHKCHMTRPGLEPGLPQ